MGNKKPAPKGSMLEGGRAMRDEIVALLKKHGYEVPKASLKYDDTMFGLSLECHRAGAEIKDTRGGKTFEMYANLHDIPVAALGKRFAAGSLKGMTIVGYNPRSHKNPIELKNDSGKGYKCSDDLARTQIAAGHLPGVTIAAKKGARANA